MNRLRLLLVGFCYVNLMTASANELSIADDAIDALNKRVDIALGADDDVFARQARSYFSGFNTTRDGMLASAIALDKANASQVIIEEDDFFAEDSITDMDESNNELTNSVAKTEKQDAGVQSKDILPSTITPPKLPDDKQETRPKAQTEVKVSDDSLPKTTKAPLPLLPPSINSEPTAPVTSAPSEATKIPLTPPTISSDPTPPITKNVEKQPEQAEEALTNDIVPDESPYEIDLKESPFDYSHAELENTNSLPMPHFGHKQDADIFVEKDFDALIAEIESYDPEKIMPANNQNSPIESTPPSMPAQLPELEAAPESLITEEPTTLPEKAPGPVAPEKEKTKIPLPLPEAPSKPQAPNIQAPNKEENNKKPPLPPLNKKQEQTLPPKANIDLQPGAPTSIEKKDDIKDEHATPPLSESATPMPPKPPVPSKVTRKNKEVSNDITSARGLKPGENKESENAKKSFDAMQEQFKQRSRDIQKAIELSSDADNIESEFADAVSGKTMKSNTWARDAQVQPKHYARSYSQYTPMPLDDRRRSFVNIEEYKKYIFYTIAKGDTGALDALLNIVRDTEIRNNLGDTPLIYSVKIGNPKMARYLIVKGANIDAKNAIGMTAMDIAKKINKKEIIEALKEARR